MKSGPNIAQIAALIGDPARSNMLTALLSGKALTASELANEAGVTAQTASSHLAKMQQGGLVVPAKQGRHKYFSLASEDVGNALESLMVLSAKQGLLRTRTGPKDAALRKARTCYKHLAGEMGIQLYDSMVSNGYLEIQEQRLELSDAGRVFLSELGVDQVSLKSSRTPLCKECLDWSERRSHLAGRLGRSLLEHFELVGWVSIDKNSRIVTFSPLGEEKFMSHFSLNR